MSCRAPAAGVSPRRASLQRRTGIAAILAGALVFAGQAGELVFGSPSDVVGVYVALAAGGIVALGVALWGFRTLLRGRSGRIGSWLGLVGAALLGAFAVQAAIEVARAAAGIAAVARRGRDVLRSAPGGRPSVRPSGTADAGAGAGALLR